MKFLTYHYPLLRFRGSLFPWTKRWDQFIDGQIVTTHEGVRIRIKNDAMYRTIYHFGDYEPFNTKIYKRIIRPGETILDIGANFGWYANLFAKWVGSSGHVHAFEPVPFIHEYTKDSIMLNAFKDQIHLNFFGLGRSVGEFTVYTFKGLPHGHATATDLGRNDAIPHRCQIRILDEYCSEKNITNCSFLKIDVEGHELEVFMGGRELLSSSLAPIIAFEINMDCLQNRGLTSAMVFDILRQYGYDNFYSFNHIQGVKKLNNEPVNADIDCLAFKSQRKERALYGLSAGKYFR